MPAGQATVEQSLYAFRAWPRFCDSGVFAATFSGSRAELADGPERLAGQHSTTSGFNPRAYAADNPGDPAVKAVDAYVASYLAAHPHPARAHTWPTES